MRQLALPKFVGGVLENQTKKKIETPQDVAKRLSLKFKDWLLLSRALTHRSYLNEHPEALEDNERLEFLGDAVLDFVVGAWLYNEFPEMPEGDLTRMRSALVQTEQLAEFARAISLGNALKLGLGEVQGGGRNRDALLCDAYEALVGAIYLDTGIEGVRKFIFPCLREARDNILLNHKHEDPKSKLQEWAQSKGYPTPIYVICNSSGPDHSKVFEVDVLINNENYAKGNGPSKQAAEKAAAKTALQKIGLNQ
jgi:ribonuclease-3